MDPLAVCVYGADKSPAPSRYDTIRWQSLDRCSKEDDQQAAACSQCCGSNHLQLTQVHSRAESVPATRASQAGCRWPGSVQSVYPGVQVSTQHGAWIPVHTANVPGRCHLRSARGGEVDFPRVNVAIYTYGGRAFGYVGPTSWNSLHIGLPAYPAMW